MWQTLVGAVAGAMTVFGGASSTEGRRPPPNGDFQGRPTSTRPMREGQEGRKDFGGRASTTGSGTVDFACVGAAVATREGTLDTAAASFSTDTNSAYTARASALAAAYTGTDKDTVRAAVKSAWTQFSGAMKATRKTWQKSQQDAWKQFKTAVKACGGNSTAVSDAGNAGSEMSGQ